MLCSRVMTPTPALSQLNCALPIRPVATSVENITPQATTALVVSPPNGSTSVTGISQPVGFAWVSDFPLATVAPAAAATQPSAPSDFAVSGSNSGLPSATSLQTLTPASFVVDGSSSGLPLATSTQTLAPSSFTVSADVSMGEAATSSEVMPVMTELTRSSSSPVPYVNGVLAASGEPQPPTSSDVSRSSETPPFYINGVISPMPAAIQVGCTDVNDPGADSDGDLLTNEQEALAGTNPCNPDTDNDGCSDGTELEAKSEAATGGGRDPLYYWDFMDMWVNQQKDGRVNIVDIGALAQRIFTGGDPGGDPLDPPQALTGYHVSADRSPPIGPNLWNAGPPDGDINIIEIGLAVAQFLHDCN